MNRLTLSSAAWRKSSHSGGDEGSCVEVATVWQKSSYSGGDEGDCVEVAGGGRVVAARDSKDPEGPVLCLGADAWRGLCDVIRSGKYDLRG
ncbi:DUF397 domain-containing protein [Spirillospora sp. CA-294931]|uniref:DUF397 domain-containing protein n=1 Tax=Spirillospora sp. CA-294931 TaxID=3240042 RepID=UPI003D93863E